MEDALRKVFEAVGAYLDADYIRRDRTLAALIEAYDHARDLEDDRLEAAGEPAAYDPVTDGFAYPKEDA